MSVGLQQDRTSVVRIVTIGSISNKTTFLDSDRDHLVTAEESEATGCSDAAVERGDGGFVAVGFSNLLVAVVEKMSVCES